MKVPLMSVPVSSHPKDSLFVTRMGNTPPATSFPVYGGGSSRCPAAIPNVAVDMDKKSDSDVLRLFGKLEDESVSAFITRTKGLIVLMATIMQVRTWA